MLGQQRIYTVCDTLASPVCVFVTQNYYSDTLVGQTFEWMIRNAPRVARVCYRETITVEMSLGIREAAVRVA